MTWESLEKKAEKGPMSLLLAILAIAVVMAVILGGVGYVFGWFGEAGQVAQKEFGPKAALQKYEWFIEQSNAIAKMDADIALFEKRVKDVDKKYEKYGDATKWPIHVSTTYNREIETVKTDLLAVVSQRNNLAKDYNAASDKFNWGPFKAKSDKPKEKFQEYRQIE